MSIEDVIKEARSRIFARYYNMYCIGLLGPFNESEWTIDILEICIKTVEFINNDKAIVRYRKIDDKTVLHHVYLERI